MNIKLFINLFLIFVITCSLISSLACGAKVSMITPTPTPVFIPVTPTPQPQSTEKTPVAPDLGALQQKVQIEEAEYSKLLESFSGFVSNIKDPCSIDIRAIFPDNWQFEFYTSKTSGSQMWALAIPIPPNIKRGFQQGKTEQGITSMTFGEKMTPNTNIYIAPTWNGLPYDWRGWIGISQDIAKYPVPVTHEYFETQKMLMQPYFIPDEATHGVYTANWTGKDCTKNRLANIVSDIFQANPYKDRSFSEQYNTPSTTSLLDSLSAEISRMQNDRAAYIKFVDDLNTTFFKPNASTYNKGSALDLYKNELNNISDQLSKINTDYISKIKAWDFSNLNKYRELKK